MIRLLSFNESRHHLYNPWLRGPCKTQRGSGTSEKPGKESKVNWQAEEDLSCPPTHVTQGQVIHLLSTARAAIVACLCWEGPNSACSHKDSLFLYTCIPSLWEQPKTPSKSRWATLLHNAKHCLQVSLSHLLWEYRGCWALECCCSWSSAAPTALPGHHRASTPTKAGQPLGLQNNLPLKSTESQSARIFKRLTEKKAAKILSCLYQKVNF